MPFTGNLILLCLLPMVLAHHPHGALATNYHLHNQTWPTAASTGLYPTPNQSVASQAVVSQAVVEPSASTAPEAQQSVSLAAAAGSCGPPVTVTISTARTVTLTVGLGASSPTSKIENAAAYTSSTNSPPKSLVANLNANSSASVLSTSVTAVADAAKSSAQSASEAPTSIASPAAASQGTPSQPASTAGAVVAPSGKPKRGIITSDGLTPLMADNPKIGIGMSWNERFQVNNPAKWAFLRLMIDMTPDTDGTTYNQILQQGVTQNPNAKILSGPMEKNPQPLSDIVHSWKSYIEPWGKDYQILGPMFGANATLASEFEAACTGCPLAGTPLAFTSYGSGDDAGIKAIKGQINEYSSTFPGRKLWVTNVGMLDGSNGTPEYLMKSILPWLDSNDNVEYYMWNSVGGTKDVFVDYSTKTLSSLGKLYASL